MNKAEAHDKKPKKKENLKQRAYLNSVTSILDYGARVVTTFFVTPFLVSGLGSTLFGVWKVLGQFASYTNMADIRATQVLKWAVARDRETLPDDELRRYVTATFVLVLLILPVILIVGSIIVWFAPTLTGVEEEYTDVVRIATALLILSLVINKVFSIFESILRGMNLGFKRMGFRATIFIIGGLMQVVVVLNGYGIIALSFVQVLVTLSIGVTIYFIVKKHVHWFGWGAFEQKKSVSFLQVSGWFMGWNLVDALLKNSDKIILGFFAGSAIVTQYVITEYLIKSVRGVISNVVHGVKPGLGKLYGAMEYQKMLNIRNHIFLISWLLTFSIGSVTLSLNQSFINIWIAEQEYAGQIVNLLIFMMTAQLIFIHLDVSFISMSLDIKHRVYVGGVSVSITFLLAIFLVGDYGILGLCISYIIGRLVLNIVYPAMVYRKMGKSILEAKFPFRIIIATLVFMPVSYYLGEVILIDSWFNLILFGIFIFGISTITLLLVGLNKQQIQEINNYKKKIKFLKKD